MSGNEYFSVENLQELVSLEQYIQFAQKMINKGAAGDQKQELQKRLDAIRKKQQDDKLNISVIGEFSSGKSTFINALLRQELLRACVLQGTTVASTILEHDANYRIEVGREKGKSDSFNYTTFEDMRDTLNEIVAENDSATVLSNVLVQLPAPLLQETKLRIIDTPGLEATISWHEEKTINVLEELSDLSIVLVDATRPLPESLCSFLIEHLYTILNQCVFVVTKIDMIREQEREMLLNYIETMVRDKLEVEKSVVLPYASLEIINSFAPGSYPASKCKEDLAISLKSEQKILEHTARQRVVAQTKKLASLMVKLYSQIETRMETLTTDAKERLELLINSSQIDISSYAIEQKRIQTTFFDSNTNCLLRSLESHRSSLVADSVQKILDKIQALNTVGTIDTYIHQTIYIDCKQRASELGNMMLQEVNGKDGIKGINGSYKYGISSFKRDFREHFKQLKCFIPLAKNEILTIPQISALEPKQISFAGEYTNQMLKKENRSFWGTIAAGAAAGSVIPGLGTLAGAAIGYFATAFTGPSVTEVRNQTQTILKTHLNRYFEDVYQTVYDKIEGHASILRNQLEEEIDRYPKEYRTEVEKMIKNEEQQKKSLQKQIKDLQDDMNELALRREKLEALQWQL